MLLHVAKTAAIQAQSEKTTEKNFKLLEVHRLLLVCNKRLVLKGENTEQDVCVVHRIEDFVGGQCSLVLEVLV